jgi:RNA polymerase sigma-70 factor (ECF subfamily)
MTTTQPDDTQLVRSAAGGDIDAFELLVRAHTPAVYAHALRFFGDATAAEDVSQEVWIKVYRSLSTFDEQARFSTWLYRVTRNTCLDAVRAGKRRPVVHDALDGALEPAAPGDIGNQVALSTTIETAMRTLAPEDRDALSAVSVFGLTYAEAGSALGVPAGTVKSRVFRARRMLAVALGMTAGGA